MQKYWLAFLLLNIPFYSLAMLQSFYDLGNQLRLLSSFNYPLKKSSKTLLNDRTFRLPKLSIEEEEAGVSNNQYYNPNYNAAEFQDLHARGNTLPAESLLNPFFNSMFSYYTTTLFSQKLERKFDQGYSYKQWFDPKNTAQMRSYDLEKFLKLKALLNKPALEITADNIDQVIEQAKQFEKKETQWIADVITNLKSNTLLQNIAKAYMRKK